MADTDKNDDQSSRAVNRTQNTDTIVNPATRAGDRMTKQKIIDPFIGKESQP